MYEYSSQKYNHVNVDMGQRRQFHKVLCCDLFDVGSSIYTKNIIIFQQKQYVYWTQNLKNVQFELRNCKG